MRLPKFEYFEPKEIKEAVGILQDQPLARILAGGTDLLVNMKHRVESPPVIVNIKRIQGLDFIKEENGDVRIGALTTLKRIYTDPMILEKLPGLAGSTSSVGSYHHQVMGTLAGNICQQNRCKYFNQSHMWRSAKPLCFKAGGEICHVVNKKGICYSSYCGDLAPVLLVMNAKIVLIGKAGTREISMENLFSGNGKAPLNLIPGEILKEIIIPSESVKGVCCYEKLANRESIDFPILGTAFWVSVQNREYRVAFTAVDQKPLRGQRIESFLSGIDLTEETLDQACDLADKVANPVKTSIYSPSYKRKMLGRLFRSAVDKAIGRSIS